MSLMSVRPVARAVPVKVLPPPPLVDRASEDAADFA